MAPCSPQRESLALSPSLTWQAKWEHSRAEGSHELVMAEAPQRAAGHDQQTLPTPAKLAATADATGRAIAGCGARCPGPGVRHGEQARAGRCV